MGRPSLSQQAAYPPRQPQRRCATCGKLVSRTAYVCQRCGKRQRIRPQTLVVLCLAAGVIVGMFAVAVANAGTVLP